MDEFCVREDHAEAEIGRVPMYSPVRDPLDDGWTGASMVRLTDRHFAGLLGVRTGIAVFEKLSEREARAAGASHVQHHVLLALRGHPDPVHGPTVKDVAVALGVSSPSAVELISRMVGAGLLERYADETDARLTRVGLTALGQRLVNELSELHLPRLRELTRHGVELLND
jgi:DNA-binding MarR family transcriptional regulator